MFFALITANRRISDSITIWWLVIGILIMICTINKLTLVSLICVLHCTLAKRWDSYWIFISNSPICEFCCWIFHENVFFFLFILYLTHNSFLIAPPENMKSLKFFFCVKVLIFLHHRLDHRKLVFDLQLFQPRLFLCRLLHTLHRLDHRSDMQWSCSSSMLIVSRVSSTSKALSVSATTTSSSTKIGSL